MKALRSTLLLVAVAFSCAVLADPGATGCTEKGKVSISAKQLPIRLFLCDLADQSKLRIAIDPKLRGRVTLDVKCLEARTVLELALGQVSGAYCEDRNVLIVSRRGRAQCSDPQPVVERVGRSR